jgi:hypothetical protein
MIAMMNKFTSQNAPKAISFPKAKELEAETHRGAEI